MADDQNLSPEERQQLQEIAMTLPPGHPAQKKVAALLASEPTQFERTQNDLANAEGPIKRYARSALSSAGLPETISDIPDWGNRMIARDAMHPYGQWAPQYEGSDLQKAISKPNQENLVNAVPFIGPTSVEAARQVREGNYAGATGTLTGLPAAIRASGEVRPGLRDLKTNMAESLRNADNSLKPAARLVGGGTGAALGAAISPHPYLGATIGGSIGGGLTDFLAPERAPAFKSAYPGYHSDFADVAPGAFQNISESPTPKPLFSKIPSKLPASMRGDPFSPPIPTVEATPVPAELGSAENPGLFSKLPTRLPSSLHSDPFQPRVSPLDPTATPAEGTSRSNIDTNSQDLISRMKKIAVPGEEPSAADLKRAGDFTQVGTDRLKALAKFGDKLAQNELNRRLRQ